MGTIIISVGTSFLTNLLDKSADKQEIFNNNKIKGELIEQLIDGLKKLSSSQKDKIIRSILEAEDLSDLRVSCPIGSKLNNFCNNLGEYLNYIDKKASYNIKKRADENKKTGRDLLPAEISSLFLHYYFLDGTTRDDFKDENRPKDNIILLCTDTADSVFCAAVIREIIKKCQQFNTKARLLEKTEENQLNAHGIKYIPKLDVYNPDDWVSRDYIKEGEINAEFGLANMYDWFNRLKNCNVINARDIIIRTAGYKELSADLKLLGFQFGLKSLYLFENSAVFIETYTGSWPGDFSIVAKNSRRMP